MAPRVVRFVKSDSGTSMETHEPVVRAGVVASVKVSSCSTSSPPWKAPSAPKSTSFTLNSAGLVVASGVQMSIRKRSMALASMGADPASMPANTRFV